MVQTFDVIIIGAGFLGLSCAYQLSKTGVRTLVLEAGDIGSGTSASCSGRAQVCEGHLDSLNIHLIRQGIMRHETLEEELNAQYDWRKAGLFLLIKSQEMWNHWKERAQVFSQSGIPAELVDQKELQKAEPNLNTSDLLGAVYAIEGILDPLKFSMAYMKAARNNGAEFLRNSKVIKIGIKNNRAVSVHTKNEVYFADKVAIMAGAWSKDIALMAGVDLPIQHTHAEAIVTEPLPPVIHNGIELADFYETIFGEKRAVAIGVHAQKSGTLDISEAVTKTDLLHKGVSAWGISSISRELLSILPLLNKARVVRSWGRPTSFTPDEEPLVGWVPGLDNLYIATSLVETITSVPVLSEWMAMMLCNKKTLFSLDKYSPSRFLNEYQKG